MHERWFSLAEIAEYLGVSRDSVYRWVEDRAMPAHKVGRQWKFKTDEVDAWVRSGQAEITVPRETNTPEATARTTGRSG